MPKNKKPAGGRAPKNFDPRYGQKKSSYQDRKRRPDAAYGAGDKPGSRSPKHRGYRAETDEPAKRRWTAQERAGRDEARGIRTHAPRDRDARPARDERRFADDRGRPTAGASRSHDGPRGGWRDRAEATERRDDARGPARSGRPARGDRPARDDRRFDGDRRYTDRPARDDRRPTDRAARDDRRFDGDRRQNPTRTGGRYQERPAREDRRFDGGSRQKPARDGRGYDDRRGSERPTRRYDDRPVRDDRAGSRPERRTDDRRAGRPNRSDWTARTAPAQQDRVDVVHDRLRADAVQAQDVADTTFADLGLGDNIVRTLDDLGAQRPFPIQASTIPVILDGRDVLARGRTGSGKTIAFGAPLVEAVLRSQAGQRREFGRSPKALILAPTRELALQIDRTIQPIARSVGLFTTQIYGGVPQARQVGALKKGVDIIIGTPGRIEDLVEQRKLDLSEVRIAVLDEADHMCELGFLEPVQRILRLTGEGSQKLLFSATLDREVASLVDEFLVEPAVHEVAGEDQASSTIDHRVLVIDHRDKPEILASLVDREGKTLVFTRTRAYAEMLAEQFEDAGIHAVALHGDLNQAKRTRNLARLTSGRVSVLVATDVAARGIHVDDIDLVVQADPPDEFKTYLHRSGRTGRAGRAGTVVSLVTRQRRRRMAELLDRAEIDAPFEEARPGDDLLEELSGRQVVPV
ncbi:DEAD/DEAH box helicase [Microbacterium koreense]|uniref:DEAD/DEAH box helicase n=2 Tax=Microbacterium koreense TaxID=323761 RepID=A0ABW2ZPC2_9MICO